MFLVKKVWYREQTATVFSTRELHNGRAKSCSVQQRGSCHQATRIHSQDSLFKPCISAASDADCIDTSSRYW